MHFRALILLLTCCFIHNAVATEIDGTYTLYLVRHAEKQPDGSKDPILTLMGKHRAEQLALCRRPGCEVADRGRKKRKNHGFLKDRRFAS